MSREHGDQDLSGAGLSFFGCPRLDLQSATLPGIQLERTRRFPLAPINTVSSPSKIKPGPVTPDRTHLEHSWQIGGARFDSHNQAVSNHVRRVSRCVFYVKTGVFFCPNASSGCCVNTECRVRPYGVPPEATRLRRAVGFVRFYLTRPRAGSLHRERDSPRRRRETRAGNLWGSGVGGLWGLWVGWAYFARTRGAISTLV